MPMSDWLAAQILQSTLEGTAFTPPSTRYLALYTADPTSADTGTEVTGGSYARQTVTFGSVTGDSVSNTGAVSFSSLPACTVLAIGVRDALTAGHLLYSGLLATGQVVSGGGSINFGIGQLTIAFT